MKGLTLSLLTESSEMKSVCKLINLFPRLEAEVRGYTSAASWDVGGAKGHKFQ